MTRVYEVPIGEHSRLAWHAASGPPPESGFIAVADCSHGHRLGAHQFDRPAGRYDRALYGWLHSPEERGS